MYQTICCSFPKASPQRTRPYPTIDIVELQSHFPELAEPDEDDLSHLVENEEDDDEEELGSMALPEIGGMSRFRRGEMAGGNTRGIPSSNYSMHNNKVQHTVKYKSF